MPTIKKMIGTICMAVICTTTTPTALAHHGAAQFDPTQFVVIEGTVQNYKWGNPHVYMSVVVSDASGRNYVQQIEAAPASQLLSRGVTRDLVRVGDHVTIRANPHRGGQGYAVLGYELIKADGSRYPLTTAALKSLGPGEGTATSVAGTWVPQPERFMTLQAAIKSWPRTELANKVMATSGPALAANRLKCIPQGAPFLMALSVPIAISVNKATVTLDVDFGDDTQRIVHMGTTHPATLQPTPLGHSVGHWEGTTLIVDTTGFESHPDGLGYGFPSSRAKHTAERLALSTDHKHLDYDITIEDPTYIPAPVKFQTQWDYRPGQKPSNARCDADSAQRYLEDK
jgi:Family of unknown function (DUF6152)